MGIPELIADALSRTKVPDAVVAREVGVSRRTLIAWRRGERRPDRRSLLLLAEWVDRHATAVRDAPGLVREAVSLVDGHIPTYWVWQVSEFSDPEPVAVALTPAEAEGHAEAARRRDPNMNVYVDREMAPPQWVPHAICAEVVDGTDSGLVSWVQFDAQPEHEAFLLNRGGRWWFRGYGATAVTATADAIGRLQSWRGTEVAGR